MSSKTKIGELGVSGIKMADAEWWSDMIVRWQGFKK